MSSMNERKWNELDAWHSRIEYPNKGKFLSNIRTLGEENKIEVI